MINIIRRLYTYLAIIIFNILLIFVIGHFVLGFGISIYKSVRMHQNIDSYKMKLYHSNATLIKGLDKEFSEREYQLYPYYHWKSVPYNGLYINVNTDGLRKTIKPSNILKSATNVFMFGGSTMWGTGSPDSKTIPSLLQKLLGNQYNVTNFGQSGFVSVQELNQLLEQLSFGNIPDIVIFYDGSNDTETGVYCPGIPREPASNVRALDKHFLKLFQRTNYWILYKFLQSKINISSNISEKSINDGLFIQKATMMLDAYDEFIKQVKALSLVYNFKVYFFWQPNLLAGYKKMTDDEIKIRKSYSLNHIKALEITYKLARKRYEGRESECIYYIADIFNDVNDPLYIDWTHIAPDGNKIIAKFMYKVIKP